MCRARQQPELVLQVLHLHEHEIQRQMLSKKSDSHRRLMEKKRKMQLRRLEKRKTLGERQNSGGSVGSSLRHEEGLFVAGDAENAENNVPTRRR